MSKNRLYEVSKRLGIPAKEATEILRSNGYDVKNNMTILTECEIGLLMKYNSEQPKQASNPEIVVVVWDEDAYYVAEIGISLSITREALRETCSNDAEFFESFDLAIEAAKEMKEVKGSMGNTKIIDLRKD